MRGTVLALIGMLAGAPVATAGELKLEFRDGYVTLHAQDVPARQILAEWARLGQTRIINGEKVSGAPLTLQFVHVPEKQALDAVLRAASGYMAALRATASSDSSIYDRVVIMPTSAPVAASRTPVAQPQPVIMAPPPVQPAFSEADPEDRDDEPVPVPGAAGPSLPGFVPPPVFTPQGAVPVRPQGPYPTGFPNQQPPQQPQGVSPTPTNPWNAPRGGIVPGVITLTPNQPGQPNQPNRPPGT